MTERAQQTIFVADHLSLALQVRAAPTGDEQKAVEHVG